MKIIKFILYANNKISINEILIKKERENIMSMNVNKKLFLLFFIAFSIILSSCNKDENVVEEPPPLPPGIIIHVPNDYPTIKMAADSAGINDTIIVEDGTYYEHDILLKAGTSLIGSSNYSEVIIDAEGDGRCLRFTGSQYKSTISGLTFKGGIMNTGEFPDNAGGGIFSEGEAPLTILNCRFIDNIAEKGGGLCSGSENSFEPDSITLISCLFDGNKGGNARIILCPTAIHSCQFNNSEDGGGLVTDYVLSLEVYNCSFINNHSQTGAGGLRLDPLNNGFTWLENCTFEDNRGGFGGGIYIEDGSPIINNCTFINNRALMGGGILASSSFSLQYCTFTHNTSSQSNGGAAIYSDANEIIIDNCTFNNNIAEPGNKSSSIYIANTNLYLRNTIISNTIDGFGIYQNSSVNSLIEVECTDIWGNATGDWVESFEYLQNQNGNFSQDPQYSNTSLNIEATSPCAPDNNSCNVLIGAKPVQK